MTVWRSFNAAVAACLAGSHGKVAAASFLVLAAVSALTVGPGTAGAAQATLSWPAPTTNTDGSEISDLSGYNLYIGNSPGSYHQVIDTGNQQSYVLDNLSDGNTYYFAVTAYNTSGIESDYSDEGSKSFPALPPASAPPPVAEPPAADPPPATTPAVKFTVADALSALKHAVGVWQLTPTQLSQYDVAPLGANGRPQPDSMVDVADAVAILRNAVGLTTW